MTKRPSRFQFSRTLSHLSIRTGVRRLADAIFLLFFYSPEVFMRPRACAYRQTGHPYPRSDQSASSAARAHWTGQAWHSRTLFEPSGCRHTTEINDGAHTDAEHAKGSPWLLLHAQVRGGLSTITSPTKGRRVMVRRAQPLKQPLKMTPQAKPPLPGKEEIRRLIGDCTPSWAAMTTRRRRRRRGCAAPCRCERRSGWG